MADSEVLCPPNGLGLVWFGCLPDTERHPAEVYPGLEGDLDPLEGGLEDGLPAVVEELVVEALLDRGPQVVVHHEDTGDQVLRAAVYILPNSAKQKKKIRFSGGLLRRK